MNNVTCLNGRKRTSKDPFFLTHGNPPNSIIGRRSDREWSYCNRPCINSQRSAPLAEPWRQHVYKNLLSQFVTHSGGPPCYADNLGRWNSILQPNWFTLTLIGIHKATVQFLWRARRLCENNWAQITGRTQAVPKIKSFLLRKDI